MSQKRIQNHHYVPKVLQKAFRYDGDRIWYSSRQVGGRFGKPAERNIEKTFRIKDLYTIELNGVQSDIIERQFYGTIDDYLGRMLPSVFNAFSEGRLPTFSGEPLRGLKKVVFELIKRTPHFTKGYDDASIGRDVIEKEIAYYELHDPENPQLKRARIDLEQDGMLKRLGRTVRVRALTMEMRDAHTVLEEFEVRWAVSEGNSSFVLSDLIAYRIGNCGSNGLINPNAEIWMPISPKIALVLVRDPNKNIPLRSPESARHIRAINEYAAVNSIKIASHSEKLLLSLLY